MSETKTNQSNLPSAPPRTANRVRAQWRGLLGAWVSSDWGTLPFGTTMFGGVIGLRRDAWWGEAALGASLREELSQNGGPVIGELGVATGALRFCRRAWELSHFSVNPCAGLEWARWSSEGNQNLASQRSQSAITASAAARLVGILSVSDHLELLLPLDVVVPLNRPRFGFMQAAERQVEIFEPSWIAARVGAGFQLAFP